MVPVHAASNIVSQCPLKRFRVHFKEKSTWSPLTNFINIKITLSVRKSHFLAKKIGVGRSLEKSFYNLQQVPLPVDGAEEFPEMKADFFK